MAPPWVSFWRRFGSPKGGQEHQKATSKKHQKRNAQIESKSVPKGSQNVGKIIKNVVLEALCFKGGSQVASRAASGSILESLGEHAGTIFASVSDICLVICACMHSLAACCKQKRSKSQEVIKRMQQRASKKQLLSSCHLALKSSLANVNELSGPC